MMREFSLTGAQRPCESVTRKALLPPRSSFRSGPSRERERGVYRMYAAQSRSFPKGYDTAGGKPRNRRARPVRKNTAGEKHDP